MTSMPCERTGCDWTITESSEAVALARYQSHQQKHIAIDRQTTNTNQSDVRTSIPCERTGCNWTATESSEAVALAKYQSHQQNHIAADKLQATNIIQPEKVKKPPITLRSTPEDWSYFEVRWSEYKKAANFKDDSIVVHLMECCDDALRKDLFRIYGSIQENTETEALKKIKQVAVHIENIRVARITLHQMKQDRDQPVRSYEAQLKGQANICNYTVKHKCQCGIESNVNYADEMVSNVLVSGLADIQIQRELLSDANQEMPLDQIVNLIEAKEVGNRSISHVTNTIKNYAVRSTYKSDVNKAIKHRYQASKGENTNAINKTWHCGWCGKQGHGNYRDQETRRRSCPAFNHRCKNCDRMGHYESQCKDKSRARQHRASIIYADHSSDPDVLMDAPHRQEFDQGQ